MSKKMGISIGLIIVILVVGAIFIKFGLGSGYKISITNNTSSTIENLEIRYHKNYLVQNILEIESKKTWKDNIDTGSIQGESLIILTYKDNKGDSHDEIILGYLEKGYSGEANVIINKINENGKLDIEIK